MSIFSFLFVAFKKKKATEKAAKIRNKATDTDAKSSVVFADETADETNTTCVSNSVTQCKDFGDMSDLKALHKYLCALLNADRFVAKSEYLEDLKQFKNLVESFNVLLKSNMLEEFCIKHCADAKTITDTLEKYNSFEKYIDIHNDAFIDLELEKEKDYLDTILQKVDPQIRLDGDQRRVVLSDEDYTLVIAGAGAGKTTTIAAKVKYLVERKNIDSRKILVVSFTNKAVGELRDKLNRDLGIDCPIATFHSTGNAILRKNNPEKLNIVDESQLYYVTLDYFRNSLLKDEGMVNKLIMFFASYFDVPYEGNDITAFFNKIAKANFSTMRSDLNEFERSVIDTRTKKAVTIQSEVMRSCQEVEIANFLYLNNIDYEYEPLYRYDISFARKPYTPDFLIKQGEKTAYLEHFGVTEDGQNDLYSSDELEAYKHAVRDKILLHRQHGTTLLYTFSSYNDRRPLTEHLKEKLEENGFILSPRSKKDVLEKLVASEENRYIRRLVNLICRFITNFKTDGFTVEDFDRMYHSTTNVRSKLFIDICHECYLEYDRYLKTNNAVDFQDMINDSARVLREVADMKQKLDFKYIIVDEYQDISRQRFDLVSALHAVTDAKIVAVGDDWQSIYAFSGSDITLFTKFAEKMGYAKQLKIVRTYRNSQQIIDIAGGFIQKNDTQIKKDLISPKNITNPVIIYTYDGRRKKANEDNKSGADYAMAKAVETALEQIVKYNIEEKKSGTSVLLLGRYGFDGDRLEKSGLFEYIARGNKIKSVKFPRMDITFMTAHASKGLGYDNVILINCKNETFGFPSKIEDDPVLSFVIKSDNSIDYAEERRLFYVAMTRTKNRVYMVAPEENPSEFLLEIKRNYKTVVLNGKWNEKPAQALFNKPKCPICGYPMQYRYKSSFGLRLFICTNEPEICGFMTNEPKAGKLCIMRCDKCRDGYLVVKPTQNSEYFLGCTNYKKDGTGCGNKIWKKDYYEANGYEMEKNPIGFTVGELREEINHIQVDRANTETGISDVNNPAPVRRKIGFTSGESSNVVRNAETARTTERRKIGFAADSSACVNSDSDSRSYTRPIVGTVADNPETNEGAIDLCAPIKKAGLNPLVYNGHELNEVIYSVLSCLNHISVRYYYSVTMLTDILRGVESERILKFHLNSVDEYGLLSDWSREDITATIYWLIGNHYILRTKSAYPVLHPTYEGQHYSETITNGKLKKLYEELSK